MDYQHNGSIYSDLGSFVEAHHLDRDYLEPPEDSYKTAIEVNDYIREMNALWQGVTA